MARSRRHSPRRASCGKRRFKDIDEAKDVRRWMRTSDPETELRIYKCHRCKGYHFTSSGGGQV